MGQVGYVDFDDTVFLGQRIMQYRANPKVLDSRYLLYAFLSSDLQHQFHMHEGSGSVVSHIRVPDCSKFKLNLPPIKEQKRVADILGTLDDKIELNRQTNQTLEQIAQAIFESWFVDFEPTRAKIAAKQAGQDPERAAMAAISGLSLTDAAGAPLDQLDHLTPEQQTQLKTTAALFPDALTDSELGEIPEGWVLGELGNIAYFSSERISTSELTLKNYISTENMLEGKNGISSAASLPTAKTVPRFKPGQILISNIRPYFMKIWLARFDGGRSNDVLGIEPKDNEDEVYLYTLLYQDVFFNFMMTTSKGAKMPRGDKTAVMGWTCAQPTEETKKAYSSAVRFFYEIIDSKNKENEVLKETRDSLLNKLLSGEIDISAVELGKLNLSKNCRGKL
jgi:type I restriction enzyme S subunit